jgi:three-Cys-motif partner protein
MTSKLPELIDDGLITPEVGEWGEEKYRLVGLYAEMFTKSMKGKWGSRVYIDLFSGAGRARIKSTGKIVPASPLLALNVADKFDRYIFSEIEPEKIAALEERVKREYPDVDAYYIPGDTNENVGEIMKQIPQHNPDHKVLCFCFVDPYKMDHLSFETIRKLSTRFMDFLVLIPSGMDAHRNAAKYSKEESTKVARFLGVENWRAQWLVADAQGVPFERFVRDQFGQQMAKLGYIFYGAEDMMPVRLPEKNVLLYRLAFFSRSERGMKFWDQARKYSDDQRSLF